MYALGRGSKYIKFGLFDNRVPIVENRRQTRSNSKASSIDFNRIIGIFQIDYDIIYINLHKNGNIHINIIMYYLN